MSEFVWKLPGRETGIDDLSNLAVKDLPLLLDALLNLVWDVHDRSGLTEDEIRNLHGWIAHARFAGDRELRQHRRDIQKQIAERTSA